jgi:hypothetical protein
MAELGEPPMMAKFVKLLLMVELGDLLMMAEAMDPHPHLTTKIVGLQLMVKLGELPKMLNLPLHSSSQNCIAIYAQFFWVVLSFKLWKHVM